MVHDNDCVNLLKVIKKLMYQYESTTYSPIVAYHAKLNSLVCKQGKKESVQYYYNRLENLKEVLSYHNCSFGDDLGLVHFEMKEGGIHINEMKHQPGNAVYNKFKIIAQERFWATVLLINATVDRFDSLKIDLANAYEKGKQE